MGGGAVAQAVRILFGGWMMRRSARTPEARAAIDEKLGNRKIEWLAAWYGVLYAVVHVTTTSAAPTRPPAAHAITRLRRGADISAAWDRCCCWLQVNFVQVFVLVIMLFFPPQVHAPRHHTTSAANATRHVATTTHPSGATPPRAAHVLPSLSPPDLPPDAPVTACHI